MQWLFQKFWYFWLDGPGRRTTNNPTAPMPDVMRYRSLRGSLFGGHSNSQLNLFIQLSFTNRTAYGWTDFISAFRFGQYLIRL